MSEAAVDSASDFAASSDEEGSQQAHQSQLNFGVLGATDGTYKLHFVLQDVCPPDVHVCQDRAPNRIRHNVSGGSALRSLGSLHRAECDIWKA
ncbi:hypothetical protein PC128_g18146 [Phytophthora cactorum]|nr:hypothetical protein PC121_g15413 [Phytophthora cactorum]KAG3174066.1 hypothetical protein PC128_g18146 [Phytophthora cactorum]KAG4050253.1 hypothetical protein PC123_g14509 [Phytophthora cactorum]